MKQTTLNGIRQALAATLGKPITIRNVRSVGGGSINEAVVIETDDGGFFAKSNARPLPDQFECEAAGLRALASASSSLAVPEPLVWRDSPDGDEGFLVMEYFEAGSRIGTFDEWLGRGLAELHRNSAPAFGFEIDNYCGATPQPNPWTDSWPEFFREHRLRHQLGLGSYDRGERAVLSKLIDRIDALIATDPEPPALIHGDLWSGNLHATAAGEPALIDPAPYYGHREAELGMMQLFGGFASRVWHAYDEAYPLQPGWRERLGLYELYHVMNHHTLFGGSYAARAISIARNYV